MKKLIIALIIVATIASCKIKTETKTETLSATENIMFEKQKVEIKTVGILLYDGYSTLDAMGPYQVLGELMGVNVFFVGRNKGLIADGRGMQVKVDTSIAEVKQLDILVNGPCATNRAVGSCYYVSS